MSLAAVENGLCAEPSPSWKDSGCSDFMGSAQRASGFRFFGFRVHNWAYTSRFWATGS